MLINSMIGGVLIVLINILGGNWGLFVPLNPLSAVIIGILGLPGAVGLLLFFNL